MAKMKELLSWFISVEEEEGSKAPPSEGKAEAKREAKTVKEVVRDIPPVRLTEAMIQPEPSGQGMATFEQIYEAAGVAPPKGEYSIFKIGSMLESEHLRLMSPQVKASSVLMALETTGVSMEQVIQDAMRRDQALDTYEEIQATNLAGLEAEIQASNEEINEEVRRFVELKQGEMRANNDRLQAARERFGGWQMEKHAEERRIYDVTAFFVSENPITLKKGGS